MVTDMETQMYYQDKRGTQYELEATTAAGVYGWFLNLTTGESERLKLADLKRINWQLIGYPQLCEKIGAP